MLSRRGTAAVLCPLVALAVLTACTDADADPEPAAEAFAAALTTGDLAEAPVADPAVAQEQLDAVLGDLLAFPREVAVASVAEVDDEEEGAQDRRALDLTWTYDMGEGSDPLTVSTSTSMELVEEAWVVGWSPAVVHPDATAEAAFAIEREQAGRGDVLGHDDADLVVDRPVMRLGIDKTQVPEPADHEAAAAELAEALELEDPDGFVQRVVDAGPSAYVVALTIRAGESEEYGVDDLREITGVLVQDDTLPLAPTPEFARPVLGTVGDATAEIVEQSQGRVQEGYRVGTSGLQLAYDELLGGTPGVEVTLTGTAAGDLDLYRSAPVDGEDLRTTLEPGLQISAEEILAEEPSASAIVAMEASTGAVLAAASGAGGEGLSTATVSQYPPGSTFKVVTALALLRAGLTPDSEVECTETVTVDGREFVNYPGYPTSSVGTIPLREAIAQSCNTALIAQHESVSPEQLADAAASLGVGAAMPDDVAWPFGYFSGVVPTEVDGTTHAAAFIGQGQVLVSPLTMAGLAASVVAGVTVTPTLVVSEDATAAAPPATALTSEEAADLRELMLGVVETGSSTFLQDVPGPPVGAKSGTAQYGSGDPLPTHAWMIAFQGDLAVAVLVEEGDYGTETAGPLLEEFLRSAEGLEWVTG